MSNDLTRLKIIGTIGAGGFCEVVKVKRLSDGKELAVKTLMKDGESSKERFLREVRLLSKLDHPNIVKVLGTRLSTAPYRYMMPLYRVSLERNFVN